MLVTAYALNYNNYFNKKIKMESTLSDYLINRTYTNLTNFNFNENDDVDAELVLNTSLGAYDYFIVVNPTTGLIVSRWFIIENVRTRQGQYKVNVHRDLMVDFYNEIIQAPAFIEKATLSPSNLLTFNSEGFGYSQIKTAEYTVRDITGCPWLVLYTKNDSTMTAQEAIVLNSGYYDFTTPDISTWTYASYFDGGANHYTPIDSSNFYIQTKMRPTNTSINQYVYTTIYHRHGSNTGSSAIDATDVGYTLTEGIVFNYGSISTHLWENMTDSDYNTIVAAYNASNNAYSQSVTNTLTSFRDKYIKDTSTNKIYHLIVNVVYTANGHYVSTTSPLFTSLTDVVSTDIGLNTLGGTPNGNTFLCGATEQPIIRCSMQEVTSKSVYAQIQANTGVLQPTLQEKLYTLPYADCTLSHNGTQYSYRKEEMLNLMQGLVSGLGANSGYAIDIQILPYCPLGASSASIVYTSTGWYVDTDVNASSTTGLMIYGTSGTTSPLFYLPNVLSIDSTFRITKLFNDNTQTSIDISDIAKCDTRIKLQSELDMYRLSSPDWSSQFEFNQAKLGGLQYLDVSMTLKPYNPFILIQPSFGLLYGSDFNDARGLVLQGDFSLPMTTDAYTTYLLTNKNYQNSFNRQIQSLETTQKIAREKQGITSAISAVSSTLSGFGAGAMSGSVGVGAITGAVSGAASAVGAVADMHYLKQEQAENLDYTKTQFNYSIDNIKASPSTLSGNLGYTVVNRYFPVIEYYTSTPQEKTMLENHLLYNGMTVGIIDRIVNYTFGVDVVPNNWNFIKAKLIRITDIVEDYHLAISIAQEVERGFYVEGA